MHYSRVFTPKDATYSAASAVLLNELLKGGISLGIALSRIEISSPTDPLMSFQEKRPSSWLPSDRSQFNAWPAKFKKLGREVFSPDCWKLSIPAILYVIQNNLQFVAASNLDVATFQVTYQMKILTTAAFSVALLRKRLSGTKWFALLLLAIGVGIVQLQSGRPLATPPSTVVDDALAAASVTSTPPPSTHEMSQLKGFLAVSAACLTSGLAGVYFEMVLKGSKADLWVRNVQLSLFSLLPALAPVLFDNSPGAGAWFSFSLFRHFNAWAWATVLIQVFGGLITAVVIKYSDNIMKGFATSLSIILSSVASVFLFQFHITSSFVLGASVVLGATAMYNNPDAPESSKEGGGIGLGLGLTAGSGARGTIMSPVGSDAPILGHFKDKKHSSFSNTSPATPLGFLSTSSSPPSNGYSANGGTSNSTPERPSDGNPYFKQAFSGTDTPFGGSTVSSYHSPTQPFPPSRPPSTRPSPRVSPPGPLPAYEHAPPPANHFIKMDESGNGGWRRD